MAKRGIYMPKRDTTTYRAKFSGLRLNAFGIENRLNYEPSIEIYQARVSPELWRARPFMWHGKHAWEAQTAELLMELITNDFEEVITPWRVWQSDPLQPKRPTLTSHLENRQEKAG